MSTTSQCPTLADLEAAIQDVKKEYGRDHLIGVVGVARIQDMFQHVLHLGDLELYGEMLSKLKARPKPPFNQSANRPGIIGSAYIQLESALDLMAMAISMSPDGRLLKAPPSLIGYLPMMSSKYLAQECKTVAEKCTWQDYTTLVAYVTQTKEDICCRSLAAKPEDQQQIALKNLDVAFVCFMGRHVINQVSILMGRFGNEKIPAEMVDILRRHEGRFSRSANLEPFSTTAGLNLIAKLRDEGLNELAEAGLQSAKGASYPDPDFFLVMESYGITFDDSWNKKKFQETHRGSNSIIIPQLVYHMVKGADTYCPDLEMVDEKERYKTIVEAAKFAHKRNPDAVSNIIGFFERYVQDNDVAKRLVSAGLDTELAKHVPSMRQHAFAKDLGL